MGGLEAARWRGALRSHRGQAARNLRSAEGFRKPTNRVFLNSLATVCPVSSWCSTGRVRQPLPHRREDPMLHNAQSTITATQSNADGAAPLRRVHVVYKTHLDLGYTDLAANVLARYRDEFIPTAIRLGRELLESTGRREFVWSTGSWLVAHALKHGSPAQRAELDAAIRDGLVAWHGLPFSTHTELQSRATIAHGIAVTRRLDDIYGRQTTAGKMTDVPGHTIGLVPALAAAGVRYFHVGVNPASPVPDVPDHFRWVAPDGSEVVTSYDNSYGSNAVTAEVKRLPGANEGLFLSFTSDNTGPPTKQSVTQLLDALRTRYDGADVRGSDLDAFGRIAWDAREHLPVFTGEIGDSWIYGPACDPTLLSRFTRLQRLRDRWLADGSLTEHDEVDWELADRLALIAEHSWGYDVKRYLPDYTIYEKPAFAAARERDAIDIDVTIPHTLGYTRQWASWAIGPTGFAATEASFDEKRAHSDVALDVLPAPLRAQAEAELDPRLPAAPADANSVTGAVEHQGIAVELDAHGALRSLRLDGREVFDSDLPRGGEGTQPEIGAYSYWAYGVADEQRWIRSYVRDKCRTAIWAYPDLGKPGLDLVEPERVTEVFRPIVIGTEQWSDGDEFVVRTSTRMPTRATEMFGAPRHVVLEYRVRRDADSLTLRVIVYLRNKDAFYGPEASWLTFHPAVDQPSNWRLVKCDVAVDPSTVVRDGGRVWHSARELRYNGPDGSMAITPLDSTVCSIGVPRMYEFDNTLPTAAEGFSFCLQNNAWGTNFRQWFEEDQRSEFELTFS